MKNLPPKKKYLKTLLFSVNILLLITCTDLFAAPTVHQDFSEEMLSCYTPKGGIVNGCGSNVFLSNGLPNSEDSEVEQIYRLDGFSNTASLHVCKTNLLGDKGITFYSYDSLLTKDLLSTLVYASEGESVSQTNPVRENDLATTPTICTRKDNVVDDTFYMTVFPPMLRLDPILKSVGSYEPANTTIPTTPVEVVCQGSDSYAECQVKALSAYSKSYESNAVPLLVSTIPSDNDKAVDPKLTKLTMVFNESIGPDIFPASGYLKQLSDDSIIETFSASDDKVTIDSTGTILTITLSNSLLLPESDYYIQVEMGLVASQTTNNLYSGITFNDTWNFTTNGYPLLAGVSIKGVAAVSSKLTAVPGAFSDPDIGDTAGVYGYQWYRGTDKNCDLNSTPITDAITSSYTPIGTDVDNLLCVAVTPKDNHGLLGVPVFSEAILKTIKATQKITFTDTSNVLYTPNLTFTTSATSGSGLVVTVAVDPESDSFGVCTISGSTVTVNFAGNCDLVASQTGDEKYAPAKLACVSVTTLIDKRLLKYPMLRDHNSSLPSFFKGEV